MNATEFKSVLVELNDSLTEKDKQKSEKLTLRATVPIDQIAKVTVEKAVSYKVNLETNVLKVDFRRDHVEKFVKAKYQVSDDDFKSMLGEVFATKLFRAYNKFLENEVNENVEQLL